MKFWAALLLLSSLFLLGACEKHPASDLQKVESGTPDQPAKP